MEALGTLQTYGQQPGLVDHPDFDVVLVHGRGGNARETWSSLWSEQCVPDRLTRPMPRVFAFDYQDRVYDQYRLQSVCWYAEKLLQDLIHERTDHTEEMRPIVFIGHSTGGVIIKQAGAAHAPDRRTKADLAIPVKALITAQRDLRFRNIAYSACAAIFFATPHRGYTQVIRRIFEADPLNQFLGILPQFGLVPGEDIEAFDNISVEFLHFYRNDLLFQNFAEGKPPTGLATKIVEEQNASLDQSWDDRWDKRVGMRDQDHFQICIFGTQPQDGPNWLISLIGEVKEQSTKFMRGDFDQERRKSLQLLGTGEVLLPTPPAPVVPTEGTCRWIEDYDYYRTWIEWKPNTNSRMLWLSGGLGCGKTYLAAYITSRVMDQLRLDAYKHDFVISFSLGAMKDGLITPWQMLACLIHSTLINYPLVAQMIDHNLKHHNPLHYEDLQYLWYEMIATITTADRPRRLTIIVDEMDRMAADREALALVLKLMVGEEHIQGMPRPKKDHIRLLVISRPGGVHSEALKDCNFEENQIPQHATKDDIKETVEKELRILAKLHKLNDQERSHICDAIQNIAGDMYILARLALREIAKDPRERAAHALRDTIASFYDSILERLALGDYRGGDVEEERRSFLRSVLFWMVYQGHAMDEEELQLGLAMLRKIGGPNVSPVRERVVDEEFVNNPQTGYSNLTREILLKCAPLVRLRSDGRFEPIHRSLKEFLSIPPICFQPIPDVKNHPYYAFDDATSDEIISSLCMDYLLLDAFKDAGKTTGRLSEWEDKVEKRIDDHEFIAYASKHWIYHAKLSGEPFNSNTADLPSESRQYQLLDVKNPRSQHALSWAEVWWYFTSFPKRFPGTGLEVAKIFGATKKLTRMDFKLDVAKQLTRTSEGPSPLDGLSHSPEESPVLYPPSPPQDPEETPSEPDVEEPQYDLYVGEPQYDLYVEELHPNPYVEEPYHDPYVEEQQHELVVPDEFPLKTISQRSFQPATSPGHIQSRGGRVVTSSTTPSDERRNRLPVQVPSNGPPHFAVRRNRPPDSIGQTQNPDIYIQVNNNTTNNYYGKPPKPPKPPNAPNPLIPKRKSSSSCGCCTIL